MPRRKESLFDLLMVAPWWASVLVSALTYVGLTYIIPALTASNPILSGLAQVLPNAAPYFAGLLLVPAPIAAWNSRNRRRRVDRQTGISSIRQLGWREIEQLVAEIYRRRGYRVAENTSLGPDGGIDLRLTKDGGFTLVQCKHWHTRKVGVSVVRELFGVMTSEGADAGIVVCTGIFTEDAKVFAQDKPIDLVDGTTLATLTGSVQNPPKQHTLPIYREPEKSPQCPRCSAPLVRRRAHRGANAGSDFMGCSRFPKCRYTESLT